MTLAELFQLLALRILKLASCKSGGWKLDSREWGDLGVNLHKWGGEHDHPLDRHLHIYDHSTCVVQT